MVQVSAERDLFVRFMEFTVELMFRVNFKGCNFFSEPSVVAYAAMRCVSIALQRIGNLLSMRHVVIVADAAVDVHAGRNLTGGTWHDSSFV
jgi:hypothetical protein|mmetsp:Transcript_44990/g.75654  ORF Transcript_44990/g.75654 Transcript_44990/m.75654 type:complete len:91 (+) Transcript_44990:3201-3473(+)